MITTTTTQHLGHAAGRARRVPVCGWRHAAAGFRGLGTTGVDSYPLPVATDGNWANTTDTTEPAAATATTPMTIKRPARHLGRRST